MHSRLDSLIQSCPPPHKEALLDLLTRLCVPDGAQLLRHVLHTVEELLVSLADDIQSDRLRKYRDASRMALKLVGQRSGLTDESFPHANAFPSDPIYKVFADSGLNDPWEKRSLRSALLIYLLQENATDADLAALSESVKNPPAVSAITVPPDSFVIQLQLIQAYLQNRASSKASLATLASIIERVCASLITESSRPEQLTPPKELLESIRHAAEEEWRVERNFTSSEQLKKLTSAVGTRILASMRHMHKPLVHQLHEDFEIGQHVADAYLHDRDLGDWLVINAVLSRFSNVLLGGMPVNRVCVSEDRGVLSISAPVLGKRGQAKPEGEAWTGIASELHLPVPWRVQKQVVRLTAVPGYSHEAMKAKYQDFVAQHADSDGIRLPLAEIHRLLPKMLGGGSTLDNTLLHLLGLSDINRRDAGIFYFSPSIPDVLERYQRAVRQLVVSVLALPDWLDEGWTAVPDQSGCFGCSVRPSSAALKKLVTSLRNASELPRGRPTFESRLMAFNAEAAYVTVLFLASTGGRPLDEVFPDTSAWDARAREIMLSEKDSLLYRSTRKVPLVERLLHGVEHYTERRRDLEKHFGKRFDARLLVFLVTPEGEAVPPTIANMKMFVPAFAESWPWPNDILRHHFRSRLWELGCQPFVLEHAMGHLGKSQTADTPLRTQPIASNVRPSIPYTERLLDEIGF